MKAKDDLRKSTVDQNIDNEALNKVDGRIESFYSKQSNFDRIAAIDKDGIISIWDIGLKQLPARPNLVERYFCFVCLFIKIDYRKKLIIHVLY